MLVLTALGNRIWGHKGKYHLIGIFLMTMGVFIGSSLSVTTFPFIFCTFLLFRMRATASYLDMLSVPNWGRAFLRSLWIMPHAILMSYLTLSILPFIIGGIAIFLIPAIYYVVGKLIKKSPEPVATSELLVGALIYII